MISNYSCRIQKAGSPLFFLAHREAFMLVFIPSDYTVTMRTLLLHTSYNIIYD